MALTTAEKIPATSNRLVSLDFMRGLIMVFLALESTGLYEHLAHASGDSFFNSFMQQFFHHPWNGLRFWIYSTRFHVYCRNSNGIVVGKTTAKRYGLEPVFKKSFKEKSNAFLLGCFRLCSTKRWQLIV